MFAGATLTESHGHLAKREHRVDGLEHALRGQEEEQTLCHACPVFLRLWVTVAHASLQVHHKRAVVLQPRVFLCELLQQWYRSEVKQSVQIQEVVEVKQPRMLSCERWKRRVCQV